jgi:hypothetical protein
MRDILLFLEVTASDSPSRHLLGGDLWRYAPALPAQQTAGKMEFTERTIHNCIQPRGIDAPSDDDPQTTARDRCMDGAQIDKLMSGI